MACANIERTPQYTMSTLPYPDSGLGLDYDSDTEEGEEDKLSPVESVELCRKQDTSTENSSPKDTKCDQEVAHVPVISVSHSRPTTTASRAAVSCTQPTSVLPHLTARLRRKFKKSRSDKLLRMVLKRAQNNVNKQLFPPQQLLQQHQQKDATKRNIPQPSAECMNKAKDYRDLKYISAANLSRLLKTTDIENTNYTLIDCRLPIEFCRGSMTNAINLHTKEMIQHFYCMTHKARNSPKVLIFYSNHVIDEALRMAYFLRTLDLKTNDSDPSKLVFPTVYLMNESFKSFSKEVPGVDSSQYLSVKSLLAKRYVLIMRGLLVHYLILAK